jgi:tetratricopeptide (TPR) repeat protein
MPDPIALNADDATVPTKVGFQSINRPWLAGLLLVLVTAGVYLPVLRCGFIWDDDYYVTNNQTLRDVNGLERIWTQPGAVPQYYPLVHTVFWGQYQLFGLSPLSYHMVNVVCHILVSLLWWRLLRRLSIPGAYLAAMIFAVHPIQVESVVWVTELKNVLSGVFYLLTAHAYLHFVGVSRNRVAPLVDKPARWLWYVIALMCFTAALLSKTVVCTLPAALVLVMWWQRRRFPWRDLLWLLPMLALGLIMGLHTAGMEKNHVGAEGADWAFGFADRLLIAGRALWFYIGKLLWPAKLVFFYDYWHIDPLQWWQWLYPMGFVLLLYALLRNGKCITGKPLVAVLFYAGTLFPALGFVNVFPMRYAFVADHFQYLAGMGIIALFSGIVWHGLRTRCQLRLALSVVIVIALGIRTLAYIPVFTNQTTLWQHVITHNHAPWMALNNLGVIYQNQKENDKAELCFKYAIVLRPQEWNTYNNLGILYRDMGRYDQAARLLEHALPLETRSVTLYATLARVREKQGDIQQAIALLQQAATKQTQDASLWVNAGILQLQLKAYDNARKSLEHALELAPHSDKAWLALGRTYEDQNQLKDAIACYRKAVLHIPKSSVLYNRLALTCMQDNQPDQAIDAWLIAVQHAPKEPEYVANLGAAYLKTRQWSQARMWLRKARELAPHRPAVLRNLILCLLNDPQSSVNDWQQARECADTLLGQTSFVSTADYQLHATACEAAGDFAAAIKSLAIAIQRTHDVQQLKALQQQLRRCEQHLTTHP